MTDFDVGYLPPQWSNFLSAEVGASAALTGLLFVAVSINLDKIISFPRLVPRAGKALVTLIAILFAASLCLVPGQPQSLLGFELILLGAIAWIMITRMQQGHARDNPYMTGGRKVLHGVLAQLSVVPVIVCGASLLFFMGGGLYWLVAATIVSFASALLDAWVLLIEIQR